MSSIVKSSLLVLMVLLARPALAEGKPSVHVYQAMGDLRQIAASPWLIEAVEKTNRIHQNLGFAAQHSLNQRWRTELVSPHKPMIEEVLHNSLSRQLEKIRQAHQGQYLALMVVDKKGLSVGQTYLSQNFWHHYQKAYIKPLMANGDGTYQSQRVYFDSRSKQHYHTLAVRINNDNHPIGVLIAKVPVKA